MAPDIRVSAKSLLDVIVQCPQCRTVDRIPQLDLAGHWAANAWTCPTCSRIYDFVMTAALVGH